MQEGIVRRSNADRTAETRARLLTAARQLFVTCGYAATSTPMIVKDAGVTRGALYHHFADKESIFRAVVEAEATEVASMVERSSAAGDTAAARLIAGAAAYLQAMNEEGRVRLLLIDGPSILGREAIRDIESSNSDLSLRTGLKEAMAEGSRRYPPVEAMSSLFSAMFERAAIDIAEGAPPKERLATIEFILDAIFCR